MIKLNRQPQEHQATKHENQFGLEGSPPPLEYVFNFIREYVSIRKKLTMLRKLTQDDAGNLTKAAWIAYNRQLSPAEYLQAVFSKHQRMPRPSIPSPEQLCSKFAVDVVCVEVIRKIEIPAEIRAHELAKKNHGLRLDHDSDYHKFIAELKDQKIENVEDAEFKCAYCKLRDVQATGEPSNFIAETEERIAIHRDHEDGNE